jgi:hypothetical protein
MLVHRIDRRNENRWFRDILWFDEPQWHRTGSNQVPVGIGEQGSRNGRMVMRIFDNNV